MKMKREKRSAFKALTMVTQFGINMVVPIAICSFAGAKLDEWLGTSFIVVILFFIGALAGFTNILRMAKDIYKDDGNRRRKH